MVKERLIGTAILTSNHRISIIKKARNIIEENTSNKLEIGDTIAFYLNEEGDIIIRKC